MNTAVLFDFEALEQLQHETGEKMDAAELIKKKANVDRTNTERQQLNKYNREGKWMYLVNSLLEMIDISDDTTDFSDVNKALEELTNHTGGNSGKLAFGPGDKVVDILLTHSSYNMNKLCKMCDARGWKIKDGVIC